MATRDEQLQMSFKGVPFLARTITTEGGRKLVTHEFVNTSRRNVQDLGALLKIFKFEALITQTPNGNEFRNRLIQFKNALESPGPGVLTHPWLGEFTVTAKPYRFDTSDSEEGVARFTLEFEQTEEQITPQIVSNTLSAISLSEEGIFNQIETFVTDIFNTTSGLVDSFLTIVEKIDTFVDDARRFVDTILSIPEQASEFIDRLNNISRNINSIINSPARLASEIIGVFAAIDGLSNSSKLKYEAVKQFFDFGERDILRTIPTQSQPTITNPILSYENLEIDRNISTINQAVQIAALAVAYTQVAQRASLELNTVNQTGTSTTTFTQTIEQGSIDVPFSTTSELNFIEQELEVQFKKVVESLFDAKSRPIPQALINSLNTASIQSLYNALQEHRVNTNEFFKIKEPSLSQIVTIKVQPQPASVLSYRLYGTSNRAEQILNLNNIKDNIVVSGDVKVLTL